MAAPFVRPALEVADIVRTHGGEFRQVHAQTLSVGQKRVLRAIELCRTVALGGHLERCDQCRHERNAYNSCANRHWTISGTLGFAHPSLSPAGDNHLKCRDFGA